MKMASVCYESNNNRALCLPGDDRSYTLLYFAVKNRVLHISKRNVTARSTRQNQLISALNFIVKRAVALARALRRAHTPHLAGLIVSGLVRRSDPSLREGDSDADILTVRNSAILTFSDKF